MVSNGDLMWIITIEEKVGEGEFLHELIITVSAISGGVVVVVTIVIIRRKRKRI